VVPVAIGLLGASALVWQSSTAAFSGTTSNAANSWAAGTVSLTDDDSAGAMFSASGLVPGATGTKCITVTYGGSAGAYIRLYVSANTGAALQPYVNLTIEEGSGGTFADCTGFTPSATLANNATLASLVAANTGWANGMASGVLASTSDARTYRFTYTLDAATPDAQQGASATATFQWEARNS